MITTTVIHSHVAVYLLVNGNGSPTRRITLPKLQHFLGKIDGNDGNWMFNSEFLSPTFHRGDFDVMVDVFEELGLVASRDHGRTKFVKDAKAKFTRGFNDSLLGLALPE